LFADVIVCRRLVLWEMSSSFRRTRLKCFRSLYTRDACRCCAFTFGLGRHISIIVFNCLHACSWNPSTHPASDPDSETFSPACTMENFHALSINKPLNLASRVTVAEAMAFMQDSILTVDYEEHTAQIIYHHHRTRRYYHVTATSFEINEDPTRTWPQRLVDLFP